VTVRTVQWPWLWAAGLAALLVVPTAAHAQGDPGSPETAQASDATLFPHPTTTGWWLSGQLNLILQAHGQFASLYEGAHSLRAGAEHALSRTWTIYTGVTRGRTDVLLDVESAGGHGISDALGIAGFTNLDVVRNPDLGATPYLARLMVHHTFALSPTMEPTTRGPLSLANDQPVRRIEVRVGKFSLVDFFDTNGPGSDSHLQFLNWTADNNGAFDYAADTRGYTYGLFAEYDSPRWSLRGAEGLMPRVANGIQLDWDVRHSHSENLELELRPAGRLVTRLLGFVNHANMGSYAAAIRAFEAGTDPTPTIEAHRQRGRREWGLGANVEYALSSGPRLFGRAGWDDGHNESFAYTEVNDTVEIGGDLAGDPWHRSSDRVGVALASNGLSALHQDYLRLGGLGFLLGDGTLRYGRETIIEGYYTAHLWRGVSLSADAQQVWNPGYNRDRGPVLVGSARLHVEF